MPVPSAFWVDLAAAERSVLALDYDGTLAPFRAERDQAVPYAGVEEILSAIGRNPATRLVIVSGRPADEVLALLNLESPPEIWGCHGWEHRPPGCASVWHDLPPGTEQKLMAAHAAALVAAGEDRVERKIASVAVHWRGHRDPERAAVAARDALGRHLDKHLELMPFAAGLELRCTLWDKGRALEHLLSDEPADIPVAYLGDDQTDEDAFAVLADRPRGLSVLVSAADKSTAADIRLRPPAELIDFLNRWHDTLKGP